MDAYDSTCSVSGDNMHTIKNADSIRRFYEVEAAHIIPREYNGANNINNGICLNRRLHWAFDRGMWSVLDDYTIKISDAVSQINRNKYLNYFSGKSINTPKNKDETPSRAAFAWHRENIFDQ